MCAPQVVTLEKNYSVEVRADATVEELRERAREIAEIPQSHRVRLIHAGRMLTEGGKLLADCHIINSSFVHCSSIEVVEYGDVGQKPEAAAAAGGTYVQMPGVPVYPGGPPSNQPVEPDVEQPDPDAWMAEVNLAEQRQQELLFERLRRPRQQPQTAGAETAGGGFDNLLNDPAEVRSRACASIGCPVVECCLASESEHQWLRGQGTNADFMCGLSLGFFLGIIMVFMLWELRMSRQQRMGVIMGIVMNGLFAVFRQNVRQVHAAEIIPMH